MDSQKEVQVGLVPARILKRTLAFILDIFIVDIFFTTPFRSFVSQRIPKHATFAVLSDFSASLDPWLLLTSFLIFIFFFIYATVLQYKLGQTVGMLFFGLRVFSLDPAKPSPDFWQSAVRNIFMLPLFPIMLFWIFDPLYLLFKGIRLTELMSNTQTFEQVYKFTMPGLGDRI